MNGYKYIIRVFICTVFLGITACSNYTSNKSITGKIVAESAARLSQATSSATTDSLTMQKAELTKIYTQAISEFIKAAYKKDKITFDTLYFGKHIYGQADDFPDIELPETIEQTEIRLVSPEVGQKKQVERKSLVYVNMIGWVEKENAEFVLVVFTNGGQHQCDYFIHFNYSTSSNKFELDKIEFEDYLHLRGQKPVRRSL